jgi:hypothetical protein
MSEQYPYAIIISDDKTQWNHLCVMMTEAVKTKYTVAEFTKQENCHGHITFIIF